MRNQDFRTYHRKKILKPITDNLEQIHRKIERHAVGHDENLQEQLQNLKATQKILKAAIVVLAEIESDFDQSP